MVNEKGDPAQQRGGIQVRDYTQGRRFDIASAHGSLEKNPMTTLGRALGFLSLGLGLAEVLMPKKIQRLVGVRGDHSGIIRFLGIREIAHSLLIFTQARPYPGVWSRVVGDGMDLAIVGAALTSARTRKDRAAVTGAALVGLTAVDMLAATQINRADGDHQDYSSISREKLTGRTQDGAFRVMRSITINRSPEELYQYWHDFTNLPRFMYHLQAVHVKDERHSLWTAKAPAGRQVVWEAEIVDDRPNELIVWQSTANADVANSGLVRFVPAPDGRGTVVWVEIEYRPPAGAVGRAIAQLFGEEPGQQVAADLKRFKEVMETGEVLRSDADPEGYGQKTQRPAQPLPNANEERMGRIVIGHRRRKQSVKG